MNVVQNNVIQLNSFITALLTWLLC